MSAVVATLIKCFSVTVSPFAASGFLIFYQHTPLQIIKVFLSVACSNGRTINFGGNLENMDQSKPSAFHRKKFGNQISFYSTSLFTLLLSIMDWSFLLVMLMRELINKSVLPFQQIDSIGDPTLWQILSVIHSASNDVLVIRQNTWQLSHRRCRFARSYIWQQVYRIKLSVLPVMLRLPTLKLCEHHLIYWAL